jgi:hypothetical protein
MAPHHTPSHTPDALPPPPTPVSAGPSDSPDAAPEPSPLLLQGHCCSDCTSIHTPHTTPQNTLIITCDHARARLHAHPPPSPAHAPHTWRATHTPPPCAHADTPCHHLLLRPPPQPTQHRPTPAHKWPCTTPLTHPDALPPPSYFSVCRAVRLARCGATAVAPAAPRALLLRLHIHTHMPHDTPEHDNHHMRPCPCSPARPPSTIASPRTTHVPHAHHRLSPSHPTTLCTCTQALSPSPSPCSPSAHSTSSHTRTHTHGPASHPLTHPDALPPPPTSVPAGPSDSPDAAPEPSPLLLKGDCHTDCTSIHTCHTTPKTHQS